MSSIGVILLYSRQAAALPVSPPPAILSSVAPFTPHPPSSQRPPSRPLHQRRRSLRRRSFFTSLRSAPSVAAPSVVTPSVAPETTVNPHPPTCPDEVAVPAS
ncbi:hypothetical protein PIB30_010185 [Stylosanthes scabra]|uniref:Uncharacterized protein n=1 Tax=Stylosanthes scabra TaxID=79078 RepID=A0ABU6R4C0_9FABA|nr:hypothetical protein [Stylosanthes scabra]